MKLWITMDEIMSKKTIQTFTLDGRYMLNNKPFSQEIQRVLCPSFKKMGKNLDALVDVLRGGFGEFEYGEKVELDLIYYKKAEQGLGTGFFKKVIRILDVEF